MPREIRSPLRQSDKEETEKEQPRVKEAAGCPADVSSFLRVEN